MSNTVWAEPVYIPLLQWLVRGPLKQHLPQAARLWVWLHLLYGPQPLRLVLPETFTYADCREAFFTRSHPVGDKRPGAHDAGCPCQKTLAAWLFSPQLSWSQAQWLGYCPQSDGNIQDWKTALKQANALPDEIEQLLHECHLFAMTRRSLSSDLKRLCELGWLQQRSLGYGRVAKWPKYPSMPVARALTFIMQPDLAGIAANLSEEIEGQQRFFVHTDYVVPQSGHDRVEDWQDALRSLWHTSPIPPLRLDYWSASRLEGGEVVVYPVCIYYYRRGPYLCGWGQVPGQLEKLDWRNYRLDRIRGLRPLTWGDEAVPAELRQRYRRNQLPLPEEIELRMSQAWGFDYYQPERTMLVRFDAEWNERYIRNSLRHSTFEPVSYGEARSLIQQMLSAEQGEKMLSVLAKRSAEDAYYRAIYRHDDPNVRQRLRAWRPHIEVLLPWGLRQRFAQEVADEGRFYED